MDVGLCIDASMPVDVGTLGAYCWVEGALDVLFTHGLVN